MFAALAQQVCDSWTGCRSTEPELLAGGQGTWKQAFQLCAQEAHLESTYGRKFTTFFVPYSQNAISTQRQVFLANEERDLEFKKKKKKKSLHSQFLLFLIYSRNLKVYSQNIK